jgi:hypothetical protein
MTDKEFVGKSNVLKQELRRIARILVAPSLRRSSLGVCLMSISSHRLGGFDPTTLAEGFAGCALGGPVWSPAFRGIE